MLYFSVKKLFLFLFFGLIVSSCGPSSTASYQEWKSYHSGYSYYSQACSSSAEKFDSSTCGTSAGNSSQKEINNRALNNCATAFNDCVVVKENNNTVYSKQEANRVQMVSLIEDSKNTCKSLGFSEGTDKFSDCTLKLYSQKLDLAEKQNQQVVVQNQGSSTVRVIDVTRERETTMRRSMGLINGTCTLATYYSC